MFALTASLALSVFAVAAAAAGVVIQSRSARHGIILAACVPLFAEWRTPEMVKAKRLLDDAIRGGADWAQPLYALPVELRDSVATVTAYLDQLGILASVGSLPGELADAYLANTARYYHDHLAPLLDVERTRQGDPGYRQNFTAFATREH